MREELQDSIKRFVNFLNFARSFFKRKNPFKEFAISIITSLKEMMTIRQKLKMAKYRVSYHQHQLHKMDYGINFFKFQNDVFDCVSNYS